MSTALRAESERKFGERQDTRRLMVPPVGAALLTLIGLSPVVFAAYGFSDDFPALRNKLVGSSALFDGALAQGRPIAAVLQTTGLALVDTVADLRWLRLFSVLSMTAAAFLLTRAMLRWGYFGSAALVVGVGALWLPSTAIMVAWSILLMGPLAQVLGVAAAIALAGALGRGLAVKGNNLGAQVRAMVLPTALMSAAILSYQPSAMAFWAVVLAFLLSPRCRDWSPGRLIRSGAAALVVGAVSSLVGLLAVKVGGAVTGDPTSRAALLTDPVEKVAFLLHTVFPTAFYPWNIVQDRRIGLALAVLLLGAVLLVQHGSWIRRAVVLVLVGSALTLGYLANLPLAESTNTSRSLAGVLIVPVVLAAVVAQGVLERLSGRWRVIAVVAIPGLAASLGLAWSLNTLTSYFTGPLTSELARSRMAIVQLTQARPPARTWVVPSTCDQTLAPKIVADEFGLPATCLSWVYGPYTEILVRERTGSWPARLDFGPADAAPSGAGVVDYTRVLGPGGGPASYVAGAPEK